MRVKRQVARARAIAAALLHRQGKSLAEVAEILSYSDPSAAFKAVERGNADPALADMLAMEQRLAGMPPSAGPPPGMEQPDPKVVAATSETLRRIRRENAEFLKVLRGLP
jgi:hypothetical protein